MASVSGSCLPGRGGQHQAVQDAAPPGPDRKALDTGDQAQVFGRQGLQGVGRAAPRAVPRFPGQDRADAGHAQAQAAVAERQVQVAAGQVDLHAVELEARMLIRVEVAQIGHLDPLDEALGQDVDGFQALQDRRDPTLVRRRLAVTDFVEGLVQDLEARQVLAVGPVVDQDFADPQSADRGIDHAQAGGAGLALHVDQAVAASHDLIDGGDPVDDEAQFLLGHHHLETVHRHVDVEEAAQRRRPDPGQALEAIVDEHDPFVRVVDNRRPGGGGHLGDQVAAVARGRTWWRIGQGEGQVAELDPAAEIGQRQRQIGDSDPDRGALGHGLDAGEQEGLGAVRGEAAVERRDDILAQGVRIERPGRRRRDGDQAQGQENGDRKSAHGTIIPELLMRQYIPTGLPNHSIS